MRNRFLRGLMAALALALALGALLALPAVSSAGVFVGVSVNIAPPPLPVYVQPPCPEPGYIWAPGYWAWDDGAYYWVPGTWVLPPQVDLLWTPGYWGWDEDGDDYVWHAGYWGPHVGFYGGVDYGFGYDGVGFVGGYWHRGVFFYNRAVEHVGPTFVTNVYYHPVVYHNTYEHVSFNGGPGGVEARPTREQMVAEHEHHFALTPVQQRQQRMAFGDRALRADYNHGRPPIAATARPAVFHGRDVFAARAAGGPVHFTPRPRALPMRSDRPSWAAGQPREGRPMERGAPMRAQPNPGRPQQRFDNAPPRRFENAPRQRFESAPPQRFENAPRQRFQNAPPQHFEARPQNNFQERGFRPMYQPQARPEPRYPQQFRPQERAPMPMMRSAPREPPRGGGRPQGGPPQDRHDGGRGR